MRSDREEIPEGYTKEDADKAEIAEAKENKKRAAQRGTTTAIALAAPTDCQTYWPEFRYQVCGAIRVKYDSLGGSTSFLLLPSSNELANPDGFGRRQTFVNGPIYWSGATGAHPVVNHFMEKWGQYGWEGGYLKYPTTDELVNPDGIGRRQEFQGAAIYFHNLTGPHTIGGAIRDKWNQTPPLPAERSFLGYPTTDEIVVPGGAGRMNRFQNGVIYWSSPTGAHPVAGEILNQWAAAGYEASTYGYPVGDEKKVGPTGVEQQFQGDWISWPRRVSDTYCGDVCTGAVYTKYPELRNTVTTPPMPRLRPCDAITEDGELLCLGGSDAPQPQQRAPQQPSALGAPADTAIQPWCYEKPRNTWTVEPFYACAVFDDDPLHQPYTTRKVNGSRVTSGKFHLVYELESRIEPKTLKFTMRLRIIVQEASNDAAGARVTVVPICMGGTPCSVATPPASDSGVLTEGSSVLIEFNVTTPTPSPLSSPIMGFNLDMKPAPGKTWAPERDGGKEYPTIRCDNYGYLSGQGCVFAGGIAALEYGPEKNVPEVAWHIQMAQQSGIVGGTKESPLHRATPAQRDASAAIACKQSSPYPSPRPAGKQCDEYPFKTAVEGAQYGGGPRTYNPQCQLPLIGSGSGPVGFSVCLLNDRQNGYAGSAINVFFGAFRVREGDPFVVKASGGVPPG